MIKKQQQFLIKGMNQDIAETKVQPELAHSIKNLRIITDEDSGTLSLVTEKGTLEKTLFDNNIIQIGTMPPKSTTVSFVTSWYSPGTSPSDYDTISIDTYHDLCYRTKVNVINITYTFDEKLNIENVGYTRDTFVKYFSLDAFKEYISVDSMSLFFNLDDLNFSVFINDAIQNEKIYFMKGGPGQQEFNNLHLWEFIISQDRKSISVNIPVFDFIYTVNNYPSNLTDIVANWNSYKSQYEYACSNYKNWTFKKEDTLINVIGTATINNTLIIFGKTALNLDAIVKVTNVISDNPDAEILYSGNLNFNIENPIKTYVSYENKKTIKVYWIDGINQPKVINVADGVKYELFDSNLDNHFNFCIPIYCNETVNITKKSIGGFFHSGVIQYFMTYIDLNDQESKVFYQSPLYYLTDADRALSPEENSVNSFVIDVNNINSNTLLRKKLRIYSLHRSTLDSTPVAKLVYELKLTDTTKDLTVIDTGNVGMNIDPQILLFLGCEEFVPKTMAIKDNTIFFGNIESKNYEHISESVANLFAKKQLGIAYRVIDKVIDATYSTNFQLNGINNNSNINGSDLEIKSFMYNEEYMLGLQFLHKSGTWSEPIWIGDYIMTSFPKVENDFHCVPYFYGYFNNNYFTELKNLDYIAVRPLVVFNEPSNSRVLCQGLLNPTVYNSEDRSKNLIHSQSSWFFRPVCDAETQGDRITGSDKSRRLVLNFENSKSITNEIDGNPSYKVDCNLLTFNSPELEFEKITNVKNNYNLFLTGFCEIQGNTWDILATTSTTIHPTHSYTSVDPVFPIDFGLQNTNGNTNDIEESPWAIFTGGLWKEYYDYYSEGTIDQSKSGPRFYYLKPWENSKSYSYSSYTSEEDIIYSAIEKKIISNYRFSKNTNYHTDYDSASIVLDDCVYVNTDMQKYDGSKIYLSNVDKLFMFNDRYESSVANLNSSDPVIVNGWYNKWYNASVRMQYKSTPHIILKLHEIGAWNTKCLNYYNESQCGGIMLGELINTSYDQRTKFKGRKNGKPTDTSMYENVWYVAGKTVKFPTGNYDEAFIQWLKGDTYYQRYDCLKTYSYSQEAKNSIIEVFSCMIQTRINIDGRYDKNKCNNILYINNTNFNKLNDIYSQKDNFFTYHKLDSDRFQNVFPNLITWSKQKVFGESVDSWSNIHLLNVLDLDGSLGEITALKLWNNKLIAFQQKGINVIKYNDNVMLQPINGAPIEISNSNIVSGKEIISNQFGCQNEWSIVNAKSGLYFSDDYNHKLYVLSDGIKCISDELGFKSYLKNKNYNSVWNSERGTWNDEHTVFTSINALCTYYDQQLGDIYFTDGVDCLTYNENLNLFTSFYDYVDVYNEVENPTGNPKTKQYYEYVNNSYILTNDTTVTSGKSYFECNKLFDLINIENKNYWILNDFTNNTPLFYEHRAIDNLNIFGNNKDYEIELTANIDPHVDKIFDTVEIRGDAYINGSVQSGYNVVSNVNTTSLPFDTIKVNNEYQDTGTKELQFTKDIKTATSKNSMKQKFRIWRAQIGRDATNVRDRIRNYWSRIKLTKSGVANLRAKIHDIIVNVYE